jgi:hypothetical protein
MSEVDFGALTEEDRARLEDLASREPREATMLRVLANRPDLVRPFMAYYEELVYGGLLDQGVKRAAREELFRLAGADGRPADFNPEPKLDGISDPRCAAAVRFANGMARDYQSTGDNEDLRQELEQLFTQEEIVELGMVVGGSLAIRRFGVTLGRRIAAA